MISVKGLLNWKKIKHPHLSSNKIWISAVSYSADTKYKSKNLREFETEFKNILQCESEAHMGSVHEKTRGQKSQAFVPLTWLTFKHRQCTN
jgi:hypothetical protein